VRESRVGHRRKRCRTCRCSSRRKDFGVESRRRLGGGLAAERQGVRQTGSVGGVMRGHDKMMMDIHLNLRSTRTWAPVLGALVWLLVISATLCNCGTAKVADKKNDPSGDLICERDTDCTVLNYDFHECCAYPPGREPFAISRIAVERYRESKCQDGCTLEEGAGHIHPSLEGWTAACVHHLCERVASRPSHGHKDK
jgi:hypothetical protein